MEVLFAGLIFSSNMLQGIFWTVLFEKFLRESKKSYMEYARKLLLVGLLVIYLLVCLNIQKSVTTINFFDTLNIILVSTLIIFCFYFASFILKMFLLCLTMISFLITIVVISGVNDIYFMRFAVSSWVLTLIYALTMGVQYLRYYFKWNLRDSDLRIYTVTFFCFIYSIYRIALYRNESYNEAFNLYKYWIIGFILVNLVHYFILGSIYSTNKKVLESRIIELSYEQTEYSADKIKYMYEESRKMRHDLKNCIAIVDNCIANQEYQEARKYISTLVNEKIETLGIKRYSSNKVINYIIENKFETCRKKNIETKCIISSDLKNITDIDASILIGNLLDNAIEAAEKTDNPMVGIEIYEDNDLTTIIVENTIKESVLKNNHGFITTKQDKSLHGYGMISIKDIVKKYRGRIEFDEEENILSCQIILNKELIKSIY